MRFEKKSFFVCTFYFSYTYFYNSIRTFSLKTKRIICRTSGGGVSHMTPEPLVGVLAENLGRYGTALKQRILIGPFE